MEMMTKENYREQIRLIFEKPQDYYIEKSSDTNKFQRCHNFTEFFDINIRSFNKIMECAKYLDDHNIDYYSPEEVNGCRTIMLAWEDYIGELNKYAIDEYTKYIDHTDSIFRSTQKRPTYQLFMQGSKIAKYILIKNSFYEKLYLGEQDHVKRFYEVSREIDDLTPEKDLETAVKFHMNSLMYDINQNVSFNGLDLTQNEVHKYKLFNHYVKNMIMTLELLGKTERLDEIRELKKIIMAEDLDRKKHLFIEEEKKLTLR